MNTKETKENSENDEIKIEDIATDDIKVEIHVNMGLKPFINSFKKYKKYFRLEQTTNKKIIYHPNISAEEDNDTSEEDNSDRKRHYSYTNIKGIFIIIYEFNQLVIDNLQIIFAYCKRKQIFVSFSIYNEDIQLPLQIYNFIIINNYFVLMDDPGIEKMFKYINYDLFLQYISKVPRNKIKIQYIYANLFNKKKDILKYFLNNYKKYILKNLSLYRLLYNEFYMNCIIIYKLFKYKIVNMETILDNFNIYNYKFIYNFITENPLLIDKRYKYRDYIYNNFFMQHSCIYNNKLFIKSIEKYNEKYKIIQNSKQICIINADSSRNNLIDEFNEYLKLILFPEDNLRYFFIKAAVIYAKK